MKSKFLLAVRQFFTATTSITCILSTPALAQSYPNKPITIVVPYNAGGDADQSARNLATVAQNSLKQSIIVMN